MAGSQPVAGTKVAVRVLSSGSQAVNQGRSNFTQATLRTVVAPSALLLALAPTWLNTPSDCVLLPQSRY